MKKTSSAHIDTFTHDRLPPPEQWPRLDLEGAGLNYGARLNATVELLDKHLSGTQADRPVIITDETVLSYRELAALVAQISAVLTNDLKLVPGNRVLLRGANNPMMAACTFAVIRCGMVAVPTMPLLRAGELQAIIDKAQIGAALCDHRLLAEMSTAASACPTMKHVLHFNGPEDDASLEVRLRKQPDQFPACDTAADDPALIAFTSGTTGKPKGTVHFHRDILAMCDLFPRHVLKPVSTDIFTGTPPLAFTFGLGGVMCFPMRVGAATLLIEKTDPAGLLAAIDRHQVTTCFTAPTFYRQMAASADQFSLTSLKACVSAGEALPVATRDAFKAATNIDIIDGIGSTEMIHIFISSTPQEARRGAIGKAIPGYEARVVDENMSTLPPGKIGRLAVRGPTGCRYLDDERQLNYVRDGWNLTGDTFSMDEDGYLFFQARSDDMIISAGYNIAGPEVEDALLTHDAVAECAVVGTSDPDRGQIVKALIVLKPGKTPDAVMVLALQNWVKEKIAPYKYPRTILFVDELPRTETGKLQRFKLRTSQT